MKKALFALLISSALLLSACDNRPVEGLQSVPTLKTNIQTIFEKSETVTFDQNDDETTGPQADTNTSGAELNYYFNTVKTNVFWMDNLLLREILFTLNQNSEPQDRINLNTVKKGEEEDTLLNKIKSNYEKDLNKLKEGGKEGIFYNIETMYVGQRENIVTFSQVRNVYLGGAHGTYSTRYLNFDTNKKDLVQLDDIAPRDKQKKLMDLLWSNSINTIINESFISKEDFYLSSEFYFSPDGINFVYPPAVIASFSEGEITLKLYWSDIEQFINREFFWSTHEQK
ncbi:MAG TPA: hypothetical protein DD638_05045 [Pasteurellaceae bacterium]|nr:hypothetical protein [Pasteurellaceae bacterium]